MFRRLEASCKHFVNEQHSFPLSFYFSIFLENTKRKQQKLIILFSTFSTAYSTAQMIMI